MSSPPESSRPLPAFTLTRSTTSSSRRAALRLITDSIAQQRQILNSHITAHPYVLSFSALLFSTVAALNIRKGDIATCVVFLAGVAIALLSLCARYTGGYIEHAEEVAAQGIPEDWDVIVARWGEELIGSIVVRPVKGDADKGEERVEIWAWTVVRRYRGKGVGGDLLKAVIRDARDRKGADCHVCFANDHANSFRVKSIPAIFNAPFDDGERRARKMLKVLSKTIEM